MSRRDVNGCDLEPTDGCQWEEEDGRVCGRPRRSQRSRFCEMPRGAARQIALERIREQAAQAQANREEAQHWIEQAFAAGELAASRMVRGGDGSAWVEVRPANTSFAWHAKRDGWVSGPKGGIRLSAPGKTQGEREGFAVAAANALRRGGIQAFAVIEPGVR